MANPTHHVIGVGSVAVAIAVAAIIIISEDALGSRAEAITIVKLPLELFGLP